jgi:hypothetical protein
MTDAALRVVAAKVPELRALDLCTSGDEATDAGILAILASCPELRALYLPGAATSAAFSSVHPKSLKLRIVDCTSTRIDNVGVFTLVQAARQTLRVLDLTDCTAVTESGAWAAVDVCAKLEVLQLCGTAVGEEQIRYMNKKARVGMRILNSPHDEWHQTAAHPA